MAHENDVLNSSDEEYDEVNGMEREDTAAEVCGESLRKINDAHVVILSEVSKYMRTTDKRFLAIDAVVGRALEEIREIVSRLTGKAKKTAELTHWVNRVGEGLDCSSKEEILDKITELVRRTEILETAALQSGWSADQLASNLNSLVQLKERCESKCRELQVSSGSYRRLELELKRKMAEQEVEIQMLRAKAAQDASKEGRMEVDDAREHAPGVLSFMSTGKKGLEALLWLKHETEKGEFQHGTSAHAILREYLRQRSRWSSRDDWTRRIGGFITSLIESD